MSEQVVNNPTKVVELTVKVTKLSRLQLMVLGLVGEYLAKYPLCDDISVKDLFRLTRKKIYPANVSCASYSRCVKRLASRQLLRRISYRDKRHFDPGYYPALYSRTFYVTLTEAGRAVITARCQP